MEGRSRNALRRAREREEVVLASLEPSAARALGGDLAAVADLLDGNYALRRSLADGDTKAADRAVLIRRVLGQTVGETTLAFLAEVVGLIWSTPLDLTSALGDLSAEAILAAAQTQGALDDVEDELFRFARILQREAELSLALSSPALPTEVKLRLIYKLLDGKAQPDTIGLVRAALASTFGHGLDARLDQLTVLAAARRERLVAVVRVARPIDSAQLERLRAALAATYGRDVHLQVDLDPTVLGGAVVAVGDEILDGSVARRIAAARTRLG